MFWPKDFRRIETPKRNRAQLLVRSPLASCAFRYMYNRQTVEIRPFDPSEAIARPHQHVGDADLNVASQSARMSSVSSNSVSTALYPLRGLLYIVQHRVFPVKAIGVQTLSTNAVASLAFLAALYTK